MKSRINEIMDNLKSEINTASNEILEFKKELNETTQQLENRIKRRQNLIYDNKEVLAKLKEAGFK